MRNPLMLILAALLLLTVACSDGDDGTTTASEPAAEQAETAPEETTEGAEEPAGEEPTSDAGEASEDPVPAEGDIDPDGSLVFADPFQNDTIDPDKNETGFPQRQLNPVYDRLIHVAPDGQLVPGLATAWDFVDDTTFEMTLREGVTFHDGEPFNAEAVVANIERSSTLEGASAAVATATEAIDSVEAVDDLTVRFNLNTSRLALPYDLAANAGMMISPASLDSDLDLTAVGAGMYELVSFEPGVGATYQRYADYWDPAAAAAATFEIRSIADAQTRLNAVQSGEVDLTLIDENQVETAESAGLDVEIAPSVSVWNIFLNHSRGDLGDIAVRQAIQRSIDRQAIVESLAFGYGDPTVQIFPPGYYTYNEAYPPEDYSYDPEAARQLLEDAGYADGVTVEFMVLNRPLDIQMAEALQQMFAESNITVELQVVEPARFSIFTDGDVDSFMGRWGGRADPLDTLNALAGETGFINPPGGGTTEEYQALLDEIATTPEGDERTQLLMEASGEFVESALDIPIFARNSIFASNGCVVGFEPYVVGADEYRGVGIATDCE